jgi:hypothetical protein
VLRLVIGRVPVAGPKGELAPLWAEEIAIAARGELVLREQHGHSTGGVGRGRVARRKSADMLVGVDGR